MKSTGLKCLMAMIAVILTLATFIPAAGAADVPGAPWTTSPTNDPTPTWTWDAVAGATSYRVYLDDQYVGEVLTTAFTWGWALPEGLHHLQVTSVDGGGESDKSLKGYVEIDLTPPATPVMEELPTHTKEDSVTFRWVGPGDAATYTLYYRTGGVGPWAPITGLEISIYTADITAIPDGVVVQGKVVAYDAAGNWSAESGSVYTLVDRTPPTVSAISPTVSETTSNPRPTWRWSGSDTLSGVDGYWMTLDDQVPVWTTGTLFTPSSDLFDGFHVMEVTAVDNAGNESTELTFVTIWVDTTPPAVPGMPSTTSPTTDQTPAWTWDAVADAASYNVYLDGSATPLNPAPIATNSFTHADDLSEGEHHLQVSSLDAVGNESALSAAGTVVVDLTPPSAPVMVPQLPFTKLEDLPFAWSPISDADSYTFYYKIGGGPVWASIPGLVLPIYVLDISGATDGVLIQGKVVAYDSVGNASADSNEVLTTVDRTVPTVVAVSPLAPLATQDQTPTWEWSGSDAMSGVFGYWVALNGGADEWIAGTSFTPGSELADGDYVLTVKALDNAGNESTVLTFATVTVDTTPPPVPSMPLTASPTNDQTPTWSWNDLGAGVTYNVYLDGAATPLNGAPLVTNAFTHSADLSEGGHYLQATSLDELGNESAPSEAGYVTIDVTPPAAPVMAALPPYTKDSAVVFTWSGPTDAAEYTFSYSEDGGGTWTDVPDLVDATSAVDISASVDRDVIQGRVVAYDAAGNVSAVSNTASTEVDRTGPSTTAATTPTSPTTNPRPTWSWSATDDGSGVDGFWVTLDGEPPTWTTGTSFTPGTNLADGDHVLKVRGVDNIDNEGNEVIFATVAIDATPPAVPTAPVTTSPTAAADQVWTWDAVADADLDYYEVMVDGNGAAIVTPVSAATHTTSLNEGVHFLQVRAVDNLGNTSLWSEKGYVTVDRTGPAAPTVTLMTPSPTNTTPQVWKWTWPADAVRFDFGESADGIAAPASPIDVGATDTYATDFTSDGTYYVMVRAYDALDNVGDWSAAAQVTIDVTAPGVPGNLAVTSPTTDKTPTWSWDPAANPDGDLAGYEALLDGSVVIDVDGATSYTHSEELGDGSHTLQVRSYDLLGNRSSWCAPATVVVDTGLPAAPAIATLAEGYNTLPIGIDWNDVADGGNVISYVLEWANNAGFSGATAVPVSAPFGTPKYTFTPPGAPPAEGQYWFRVKTVSTVNAGPPAQTKESAWSAVATTIYDVTPPAAPVLTLETPDPTNESPQRWSWTAPEGAVGYDVSVDGGVWTDIGNACTYETTFATTGTHRFSVRAYDWLRNTGTATTGDVDVDVTPPGVPANLAVMSPTTDKTPTWGWTAVADAAGYEIRLDGAIIEDVGTATSYTHAEELGDGSHTLQVRSYDALGNESAWCAAVTVIVDTATPAAPAIEALDEGYNTSPIGLDWNDVTDGTNTISYVLEYADNAGFAGATEVTGLTASEYSFDAAAAGEGEWWFRVKTISTVNVGETKESAWSAVATTVYDVTGPVAPDVSVIGAARTNARVQTWHWSIPVDAVGFDIAWMDSRTEPVDGVDDIEDVGDAHTTTSDFDDDGAYYLYVRGRDILGNKGDWGWASVTIDVTGPAVPTGLAVTTPTTDKTPTWTWNEVDAGLYPDLAGYEVRVDGVEVIDVEDALSYTHAEELGDGTHTLEVRSYDDLGNKSEWCEAVGIAVDTGEPDAPSIAALSPGFNASPILIDWSDVTDGANDISYRLEWADNAGFDEANPVDCADSQYSFDAAAAGEGQYWFRVRTISTVNTGETKQSVWSAVVTTVYDATGPVAPIVTLLTGSPTDGAPQVWSWTRPVDAVDYDIYWNDTGVAPGPATEPCEDMVGNVDVYETSFVNPGEMKTWYVWVRGIDTLGNRGPWSAAATVVVDMTAPGTPTGLALDPAQTVVIDSVSYTANTTPGWVWDPTPGAAGYDVVLDSLVLNVGSQTEFAVPAPMSLPDGAHYLRVRAYDEFGNTSGWSDPVWVIVDTAAPAVAFISPEDGARLDITTGSTIVVEAVDPIPGAGLAEVKVRVNDGEWVDPTAIVGSTIYYVVDLPFAQWGDVQWISIRAADALGNEETEEMSFYLRLYRRGFGFGRLRFPED